MKFLQRSAAIALAAVAFGPLCGHAMPTPYGFTTGNTPFGNTAALNAAFAGQSVSGTFVYDPATPPLFPIPGGAVYDPSITSLTGSAGGNAFSDNRVITLVINELGPTGGDAVVIASDPALNSGAPAPLFNLNGFDIAGYSLVNVRLFWLEGVLGAPDFLNDGSLPATLPTFQGRLALDFNPVGSRDPNQTTSVFFNGLFVTRVPEPGVAGLLLLALAGVATVSRRRRTGPIAT